MEKLKRVDSSDADFQSLVVLLDAELAERDGEEHPFYAAFNSIDAIQYAVVYKVEGQPVACGAIKPFDAACVEVKRMFVHPHYRRKGFAAIVLQELELWALELGVSACVLETGKKQPEAIGLYQKSGYRIIPNYGQYADVENSVCMKKDLEKLN